MSINYKLEGDLRYLRRPTASTLLFAMAKQVARAEKRGEAIDYAFIHFAPCVEDGDFVGIYFVQEG